jgi:hypothetical protein
LTRVYSEVYITKPFTSRLANSEKYIVCKNFLLNKDESEMFISSFMSQFEKLMKYNNIVSLLDFEHDYYFLNKIEEINIIMGQKQLENIITTLNIIGSRNNHDKIDSLKKTNIQKCILWCEKYDIPCIKLVSSNNIFLSGIYDENGVNTNNNAGSNGGNSGNSIGSNNNSFKRNTFLKNKNHTHKNNSNRKIETNIVIPVTPVALDIPCIPDISDIPDIPISIQYAEQVEQFEHDDSNTNIISTIIENIIEKVKNNYGE